MVSLDEANRSCRVWNSSIMYLKAEVVWRRPNSECCLQVATVQKRVADCYYAHKLSLLRLYKMKSSQSVDIYQGRKFLSYLYCCKFTVLDPSQIRSTVLSSIILPSAIG